MIEVAPSILAFDQLCIAEDIKKMVDAGCDMLHFDVMDGHFVPNFAFGPNLLKQIRAWFDIPVDAHLMVDNPSKYIAKFAECGASIITVHEEIEEDLPSLLPLIHSCGVKAGVALKPDTPVEKIIDILPETDLVLIMTVEPGFGGQSFKAEMVEKIRQLRKIGYTGLIEVDGGVSLKNIQMLADAGINIAVMGTALYKSHNRAGLISVVHSLG